MRGRGKRDGQTDVDRDTLTEAEELGRDLPLVVIHHHHPIKFAPLRSQEDRVRGDGAGHLNPLSLKSLDGGTNDADLLVAE